MFSSFQGASFAGLGTSSGPVESQGMRPRDGDDKDACGRWMSDGTRNRGQVFLAHWDRAGS